jgi:acyl-CoA thioester hydrolase
MFKSCNIEIRVKAGDTDFTGNVYHPRCFEWFSIGRIEILRLSEIRFLNDGSLSIKNEPQKISFVIGETFARFHAPIRFDELIEINTRIKEVKAKTIRFEHNIFNKIDGKLLVTGYSVSICIDKVRIKSINIPDRIVELLKKN